MEKTQFFYTILKHTLRKNESFQRSPADFNQDNKIHDGTLKEANR